MRTLKLTIRVTQADIKKGCRRNPDNCPISRAAQRALEKALGKTAIDFFGFYASTAEVITFMATALDLSFDVHMDESEQNKIAEFIEEFDCEMEVKPIMLRGELRLFN